MKLTTLRPATISTKPTPTKATTAPPPTRPDRPSSIAARTGRIAPLTDGFDPGKARTLVALTDPTKALGTDPTTISPPGDSPQRTPNVAPAGIGRHSAERLPTEPTPDLLGVPDGVSTGEAPTNAAPLPGFSSGPNLASFKTAQEARAGLTSTEVESEASDETDSSGGQHISEKTKTTEDDGTVTTDTQTHDSDGKGNSTETQEVIQTKPDGSQVGHRSETKTNADGTSSSKREEWTRPAPSKTPNPNDEGHPEPTQAELDAERARLRARVADPSSENARPPADLEKLARTNAIRQMSKVNPAPNSEPTPTVEGAPRPAPRTPADPVDETPRTNTAPLRPAGGKPGGLPGTGGPR